MATETIYASYGNTIDLKLLSDGSAVDLTTVTSMVAFIGPVSIKSVNSSADIIRWAVASYATGEIRCNFGTISALNVPIPSRSVNTEVWFIAYDATNSNGVVYGPVNMTFKRLPQIPRI